MRRLSCLVALFAVLGVSLPADAAPKTWRRVITEPDRKRLAGLWRAWSEARRQVAASAQAPVWDAQGVLTDVNGAVPGPPPSPGRYRCREIKLGTRTAGMPVWVAGEATPCRFETVKGHLRFVGEGAAQRSAGVLYPDGDRQIYLGALSLGGERSQFKYNADTERNQVGVLRSIGPQRWRLELPYPKWESTLDIVEIVPAG